MLSVTSLATLAALCLATVSAQEAHPVSVILNLNFDDAFQNVYLNGKEVALEESLPTGSGWQENFSRSIQATKGQTYKVATYMRNDVGQAQLYFDAFWNGNSIANTLSTQVRCMKTPPAGWQLPEFDDSAWTVAPARTNQLAQPEIMFYTHTLGVNPGGSLALNDQVGYYGCRFSFTVPAAETAPVAVTDCGVGAGKGKALSIVGGNPKCLCNSKFGGSNCHKSAHAKCSEAALALKVDNSAAEITFADIYGQDLVITTKFEMINSKTYSSVRVGTCDFSRFVVLDSQLDNGVCLDYITVGVPVAALPSLCNFTVTPDVVVDGKKHTRYRGFIYQNYTEPISVQSVVRRQVPGQQRNVTIALPIDVLLRTEFTLPEIKDLKVYTKFDIKAAVTGQYVNPYGGSSIVTVSYAVHFPYTVTAYDTAVGVASTKGIAAGNVQIVTPVRAGLHLKEYDDYANGGWVVKERTRLELSSVGAVPALTVVPSTATAAACQAAATTAAANAFVFQTSNNECTFWKHAQNLDATITFAEIADQTGFTSGILSQVGTYVVREINLTYTHTACELDGTYTITGIVVNCATGLPAVDCPLYAPATGNSISFNLDSENFCAGQGFTAVISDALEITEFIAVPKNNIVGATEQQNAWLWNEPAYFRAQFAGLKIDRVDMMSLTTSADSHTANFATSAGLNANTAVSGVGAMGLDVASQRYYFTHPMTLAFAGAKPAEGVGAPLVVRCTVNVGYFAATSRRRRAVALRQEAEEEAGVAVVEAQGSVIAPAQQLSGAAPQQTEGAAVDDSGAGMVAAGVAALVAVMAF